MVLELELITTMLEGVLVFVVDAVVVDILVDVVTIVFDRLLVSDDEVIEDVVDVVEVSVCVDVALLDISMELELLVAALVTSLLLAALASQPPPPPFAGAVHRKLIAAPSWKRPMSVLLPPDVVQASLIMLVWVASPLRQLAEQEHNGPVAKWEESQASIGVL